MDLLTRNDGKAIPFTDPGDMDVLKKSLKHRLRVTKKFIGRDISGLHTLDIGRSNKFGRMLGIKDNTSGDLNFTFISPSSDYDVITCFEVIEHVMNPLDLMLGIYRRLKPGGSCYLSTPIRRRSDLFYGFKGHFTEYQPREMRILFEYAGFEVTKYKRFCYWDFDFMFWGIRPFLRVLTQRHQLWELRKPF